MDALGEVDAEVDADDETDADALPLGLTEADGD
jgi:hypothetical protein